MNPNANAIHTADVAAAADEQVVGADVHDAERDGRLDHPRRRAEEVQRRERQRDAVGDRERRDDDREPPDRSAEQQQADEEQQVVGSDQDVVDAGRDELADAPRARPAGVPAKYSNPADRPPSRIAWVSAPPS